MSTETKTSKSKKAKTQVKRQNTKIVRRVHSHEDLHKQLIFQILRYELNALNDQKFGCRQPDPKNPADLDNPADANDPSDKAHWQYNMKGLMDELWRYPYRLPEYVQAVDHRPKNEVVFLTPSHKDTDYCWDRSLVATNFAFGEKATWNKKNNVWFDGGRTIVLPVHNDSTGREWASTVANCLKTDRPNHIIKILELPGLEEHEDVADWFGKGGTKENLLELVEKIIPFEQVFEPEAKDKTNGPSDVDYLMDLCADTELFHDQYGNGYAVVSSGNHHEVLSLNSKSFFLWLTSRFYSHKQKVPRKQNMSDVIAALEGRARFNAPEQFVDVRLARHKGKLYLDLGDLEWHTIEIDVQGWRIIENSPVHFRRPAGLGALPQPVHGGSIELLRPYLNMKDSDWTLLIGWILGTYQSEGPYPILSITGEQGSAKSTGCSLVQELLDPSKAKLRSLPRNDHDLMLAGLNNRVLAFDNVSIISPVLSDALCRLSTWGAFATRKLYSDDEETILAAQRPIILNGIVQAANRSDLLDRMVCLTLMPIPDERRLKERELFRDFEKDKPRILGAFLDGVSSALLNFDHVKLPNPPRMADFATWALAGLPGVGILPEDFLIAYAGNRLEVNQLALEGSVLTEAVQDFIVARNMWQGTASQLYDELNEMPETAKLQGRKAWPQSTQNLGKQLRRLAPNLRRIGIDVNFSRTSDKNHARRIEIISRLDDVC
ncbi:hypothetical protein ES707_15762 [subsurface metagenome]